MYRIVTKATTDAWHFSTSITQYPLVGSISQRCQHPKVLQEILGHSRIDVTLNVYSHVLPRIQHDALNRFGRRFFGRF
jgi:integrase